MQHEDLSDNNTNMPEELTRAVQKIGLPAPEVIDDSFYFATDRQIPSILRGHSVPRSELPTLEHQLSSPIIKLPDHFGYISASRGYFEVMFRHSRRGRLLGGYLSSLSKMLEPASATCRHTAGQPLPSVDPPKIGREQGDNGRIHLSSGDDLTCIELSHASPLGILCGTPNARGPRDPDLRYTTTVPVYSLKIDFGNSHTEDSLLSKGIALTGSFLYELNVRNGVHFEIVGRASYEIDVRRVSRNRPMDIRFPKTSMQQEVSELFSFAEEARENPPLSFLSFYQVLEYFFPYAVRRNSMRKVRNELADPRFSLGSDSAIMRILSTIESQMHASETTQIATLIADSVRHDLLTEFVNDSNRLSHFSKSGPISGVDHINPKNASKSISIQVSERIYKIRNRIVHAKDDPKYADVRVLLPKSREAYSLQNDIDLVRFLAIEVITAAQY